LKKIFFFSKKQLRTRLHTTEVTLEDISKREGLKISQSRISNEEFAPFILFEDQNSSMDLEGYYYYY